MCKCAFSIENVYSTNYFLMGSSDSKMFKTTVADKALLSENTDIKQKIEYRSGVLQYHPNRSEYNFNRNVCKMRNCLEAAFEQYTHNSLELI